MLHPSSLYVRLVRLWQSMHGRPLRFCHCHVRSEDFAIAMSGPKVQENKFSIIHLVSVDTVRLCTSSSVAKLIVIIIFCKLSVMSFGFVVNIVKNGTAQVKIADKFRILRVNLNKNWYYRVSSESQILWIFSGLFVAIDGQQRYFPRHRNS